MGSGRGKSKRRDLVLRGLRMMGQNICKKCGRPAKDATDVCADFPKCKQVRINRLMHRAVFGPKSN
jgi:hypothetical protein